MGLSEAGELIFLPLGVGLATLAAWASWHLVEEPALRWKDVHWGASRDRRVGADATRSRRGASKGRHAASPTTG
jgi:peptidoglycan/LPS O-acetylase OafA/YrhL